jgi:hypothetical protein
MKIDNPILKFQEISVINLQSAVKKFEIRNLKSVERKDHCSHLFRNSAQDVSNKEMQKDIS